MTLESKPKLREENLQPNSLDPWKIFRTCIKANVISRNGEIGNHPQADAEERLKAKFGEGGLANQVWFPFFMEL